MRAALAPVETGKGEAAPRGACGIEVHAEGDDGFRSSGREVVGVAAIGTGEPAERLEALAESNAESTRNVVVASARGAESVGSGGNEGCARRTGEDAQGFEGCSNVWRGEAVVTMLALRKNGDEAV